MRKKRRVVRVEDDLGVWDEQRHPRTNDLLVRVLVEPKPEYAKQLRIRELEAQLPAVDRVIARVAAVEESRDLAALRREVAAMLKDDLNYDHAVAVRTEYEELTKDEPPRPGPRRESPQAGRRHARLR